MPTRHCVVGALFAVLVMLGATASPVGASSYVDDALTVDDVRRSVDYQVADAGTLRLYRAFFDREPDVGGAVYWITQTRDGASPDDLAYGFAQSAEFSQTYGPLTDADFLTLIYQNMLGRAPDQKGFEYWLGQMAGGLTQHGVVRWVVANAEFIGRYPYGALPPLDPGDSANCGDFAVQAEAQAWFDHHHSSFGDVAGLDQDNDLIACESLP